MSMIQKEFEDISMFAFNLDKVSRKIRVIKSIIAYTLRCFLFCFWSVVHFLSKLELNQANLFLIKKVYTVLGEVEINNRNRQFKKNQSSWFGTFLVGFKN